MCGIGVTSLIMLTSNLPAPCNARIAASRPAPGPFNKNLNRFHAVFHSCFLQLFLLAVCAAKGGLSNL